ncbi:fibroblast growth factor 1 [Anaeramoeba flamelloides]|uniref:Fibroblast growth factor 1 n=1 Tax=Anaeramoeba flamelloides TaxID=1746091 RepID=A0ABQ8YD68_9EUKA|nr:fibroblast growth factor 1 [Anaeramoeba flamelloides]
MLQDNTLIYLQCSSTNKFLQCFDNGQVDGLGNKNKANTQWKVHSNEKGIRFQNVGFENRWLRIEKDGSLNALGSGGQLTYFEPEEIDSVFFYFTSSFIKQNESKNYHIGILPNGKPKNGEKTGKGNHGQFILKKVKKKKLIQKQQNLLKEGQIIWIKCNSTNKFLQCFDNGQVDGLGNKNKINTQWNVHSNEKGIRFQNVGFENRWLRIEKDGSLNALGSGGSWTYFEPEEIENYHCFTSSFIKQNESKNYHIGILPNGQPKNGEKTGKGKHGQFILKKAKKKLIQKQQNLLKEGQIIWIKCNSTNKFLQCFDNGQVDGLGNKNKINTQWNVHSNEKGIRFQNIGFENRWLRIEKDGSLNALGSGGSWTYFEPEEIENYHCFTSSFIKQNESKNYHIGILPNGKPKNGEKTGKGKHGQFILKDIKKKNLLKEGQIIWIKCNSTNKFLQCFDNGQVDGLGNKNKINTQWNVHSNEKGIRFQNIGFENRWLRIEKDGSLNALGSGGSWTYFEPEEIENYHCFTSSFIKQNESKNYHIGILPNGQPKNGEKTGKGKHGQFILKKAKKKLIQKQQNLLKEGQIIWIKCNSTNKFLQCFDNGQVDGLGNKNKINTQWKVHSNEKGIRFQNIGFENRWLRIEKDGSLNALGSGGSWTYFEPEEIENYHCFTSSFIKQKESKNYHIGILPNGKPKNGQQTGKGKHGQFEILPRYK